MGERMSEDSTMRILRFTYDQVLDATKHQDDKINRLLTAIAFLTGGALALAALNGAEYLTRRYEFGHYRVPLALVAVGVFFVGVVATVLMLIGSLTTPLRLPGAPKPSAREDPGPARQDDYYLTKTAEASPIYFNEISVLSLGQWQTKWAAGHTHGLEREEREALVRETHNLAVRTQFKYKLTNEAVAVLSFALWSLAVAAVLVLVAAGYEREPVPFDVPARMSLAIVVGGYVWLQIRNALRTNTQTVEELNWLHEAKKGRHLFRSWFAVTSAAVPTLLLAVSSSCWTWLTLMTLAPLASLAALWKVRSDGKGNSAESFPAKKFRITEDKWFKIISCASAVVYASVAWVSSAFDHPELRIIAACSAPVVVLLAALWQSRTSTKKRLRKYLRSTA
jgi:hypothetical protein